MTTEVVQAVVNSSLAFAKSKKTSPLEQAHAAARGKNSTPATRLNFAQKIGSAIGNWALRSSQFCKVSFDDDDGLLFEI